MTSMDLTNWNRIVQVDDPTALWLLLIMLKLTEYVQVM